MNRILKVFASGDEQERLAEKLHVLERYDAFILVEAAPAAARRSARGNLVEDITDLYAIPVADGAIDTSKPRIDAEGATRAHPAHRRGGTLPAGPHHYLVQFAGPIKDAWLRGVKRAGGEPRQLWENFTYVVRADDKAVAKIAALPYVRWTGHLPFDDRLASSVRKELEGRDPDKLPRTRLLPHVYTVEFFDAALIKPGLPKIRKLGVKVVHLEPKAKLVVVETSDKKAERQKQLEGLAAVHGVRKVRQRAIKRPSNNVAARVMGTAT